MAVTFFWRCEGSTLDHPGDDYSDGDTTAALTTAVINTDTVRVGSNSLDSISTAGIADFVLSSDIVLSEGSIGFWFYVESGWQTAQMSNSFDASATGDRIQLSVTGSSSSGELRLRIGREGQGATTIITSGATLANANWYFAVARWDETNTSGKVEVYSTSDLVTPIRSTENTSVISSNFPTFANLDVLRFLPGGAFISHMDNIMVSDTYAEPLQDYALFTSFTQIGGAPAVLGQLMMMGVGT